MKDLAQTLTSFRDKWEQNKTLAFDETLREGSDIHNWIVTRNGFKNVGEFSAWLKGRRRLLDAGCGNGRVTALLGRHADADAQIVGIDLTAAQVARDNLRNHERTQVFEKDLLGSLDDIGKYDLIYCQEVLHHTSDPRAAFLNLVSCLDSGGEIAIYVYKLKAPIREYADDYLRGKVSGLPYQEALKAMAQITELGKVLSDLNIMVDVPEVTALGISSGKYDLQRFLYHFFLKCFWNPELTYEENVAINYDWYHPQLCTRHTIEEVEEWFEGANLTIIHRYVDEYGITIRGKKSSV